MTTATATDQMIPAAPSVETQLPFDLYREVHKGLRSMLFHLTAEVGRTDATEAGRRVHLANRVRVAAGLLHHHHGHEDVFIQPLLEQVAPTLARTIDDGHHEIDGRITDLEQRAGQLVACHADAAPVVAHSLYRALATFTSTYLAHMDTEEDDVMTALRAARPVDELVALEMELRGAVAPPVMCDFISIMVPAMTPAERTDMLGGMHAGAPAEIFEQFRSATQSVLSPEDYRTLATTVGFD